MADFKSLLSKRVDDAERPATLPAGTYEGWYQRQIESNKQTGRRSSRQRSPPPQPGWRGADDLIDAKGSRSRSPTDAS
jgi:hypothetical protein